MNPDRLLARLPLPATLFLSAFSGVLVVISLPKPDFYYLGWVALVPMFLALSFERPKLETFAIGYAAGLTYFAGTFYWIARTMSTYGGLSGGLSLAVFSLFVVVFAGHVGLFALLLRAVLNRFGLAGLVLAAPIWVGIELLQTYWIFGGFPWMLVGYALAPYGGLLQIATWTGIYGLSFVLVTVNAAVTFGLRSARWEVVAAAVAMVVAATFIPAPQDDPSADTLAVRLVQTNIDLDQSWLEPDEAELLDELHRLSTSGQARPELIVWPETPAPFFLEQDPEISKRMRAIAAEADSHFLLGYIGRIDQAVSNSAALLTPSGEQASRYDKIHLVPFGEYVPLKDLLFFAESLVRNVGDFTPGSEFTISPIDGHRISTTICYEDVFPALMRQFTLRGAELIVNITNDGWFGTTSAPHQHLRMARVRAVENRRSVVKVANTGITAIIDPYGRIVARTELGERTTLEGRPGYRSDLTPYVRFGDVFAYVVTLVAVVGLVVAWRGQGRKSRVRGPRSEVGAAD